MRGFALRRVLYPAGDVERLGEVGEDVVDVLDACRRARKNGGRRLRVMQRIAPECLRSV